MQRYECARGHRFITKDIFRNFSTGFAEHFLNEYVQTGNMKSSLKNANKCTGENVSYTRVRKFVACVVTLLTRFETCYPAMRVPVIELIADEMYQRVRGNTRNSRLHSHIWCITVFEPNFRVVLECYVAKERSKAAIDKAFSNALAKTYGYRGKIVRTDGLPAYEGVVQKFGMRLFPNLSKNHFIL